jgi:tetratricopeptide (TPR) repeat protein
MRIPVALSLLLLLGACTALSMDDQKRLASLQHNARLYYEGGNFEQALQVIERGLELRADDYNLNALKGMILLRQSGPTGSTDPRRLDAAAAQFEMVYDWRSASSHDRYTLFGFALTRQKQGLRHLGEAVQHEGTVKRQGDTAEGQQAKEAGKEARERADESFDQATALFEVLLERGELVRLCHYHLMQLAGSRGRADEAFKQGEDYLKAAKDQDDFLRKEYDRTLQPDYEQEKLRELQRLQAQEIEVRTFLANLHYDRKEYDKALEHLDAVLKLDPRRSSDYYNRGRILRELGQAERAKGDFRTFLATTDLPADNERRRDALRALER